MVRPEPAYESLARELRNMILERRFGEDGRLPTEAELVRLYGVSRQTVRRSFQDLVAEGLVTRTPGRGTFASPPEVTRYFGSFGDVDGLMGLSSDTSMTILSPLRPLEDRKAADELGLPGATVSSATITRSYEGQLLGVTEIYLRPEIADHIERLGRIDDDTTFIELVGRVWHNRIAGAEQQIDAVECPDHYAETLGERPGAPVLRIARKYFDTSRVYVEYAVSHYTPRTFSHRLELRRHGVS